MTLTKLGLMMVIVALMLVPAPSHFASSSINSSLASQIPTATSITTTALTIADFNVSATPNSVTLAEGSTTTSTIRLTSLSGFAGQVYLTSSSFFGTIASLDNTNITLTSGGTASATLTITVPNRAFFTDDSVVVEANGGCALSHTAYIDVKITKPDFTISASKIQTTISPGGSDTATISVTSTSSFTGLVILTPSPDSPVLAGLNASSVELSSGGTRFASLSIYVPAGAKGGNYTVSADGETSDFSLFHSADITVVVPGPHGPGFSLVSNHDLTVIAGGASNSSTITITASGGFADWVDLSLYSPTPGIVPILAPLSVNIPPSGTSTLTVSAPIGTREGVYVVGIAGNSGSLTNSTYFLVEVEAPDFFVSPSPSYLIMQAGQTCTSTLTVAGIDGFSGPVDLTATPSAGLTATLSPSSVSVPSSPTSILTVKASTTVNPGFYNVKIIGKSNSLDINETTEVDVAVIGPEFHLSANPTSLTISAGGSGTSTIFLAGENGFSGSVSLAYTAPAGITATFSSASVAGSQSSIVTVSVSPSIFPGTIYGVNVTGTSGSQTSWTIVSVLVPSPVPGGDFYLSDSQTIISLAAGTSQTATINVSANGGFTGPLAMFASPSSANLNASLSPSLVTTFPSAVALSVNSTVPGAYDVEVSASSVSGFQALKVIVVVTGPDFTLSASPSSLTITSGQSKSSTVTMTPSGGFTNPLSFTSIPPAGITVSIGPGTNPVVTITVNPDVAPGSYTITISGDSGLLSQDVTLTVNVASFRLNIVPDTITVPQNGSGVASVQIDPMNGFSGTISTSTVSPSGLSPTPASNSLTSGTYPLSIGVGPSVPAGTDLVNVTGTSGPLSQNFTLTVKVSLAKPDFTIAPSTPTTTNCTTGTACSESTTVTAQDGFSGVVSFTAFPSPGLTCSALASVTGSGTSALNCQSNTAADYTVVVYASSGALSHATAVITYHVVQAKDFTLDASSPSAVNAGQSATSTITVSAVNGFTGTVTLTAQSAGIACGVITPSIITGTGTATVSCSATVAGTYTLTVTGTSGTLVHTATATFNFVDFTIAASSPSAVIAGTSATSTITVTGLNGFDGVVTLTDNAVANLSCSAFAPATITDSSTATLTCTSTSAGSYTVTVTGTSGSLVHIATATFNFVDFTIGASSPSAVNAGQSATSTVTGTAANGFSGVVTLTDSVPSGLTCGTITPSTVTGSGTAIVSCSATTAGTYLLTVTGTSGSLVHTSTATFNFVDFTMSATSPSGAVGSYTPSTITVTSLNSFAGTVTLTDTGPAGLTCNAITLGTLTGAGTATVSCESATIGDYPLMVTGTSGSLVHTATATFHITNAPDFQITASSPAAISAGTSVTSTITITALNGFSGVVTLTDSVPSGLTCGAKSSGTVTGSGTAMVSCSATVAGSYALTVMGTSGSLIHSTTATFNFVDFTIAAPSPAAIDDGQSATTTVTINPLNGFAGVVTLTDTVPSGLTCGAITPDTVTGSGIPTVSCSATVAGTYSLTVKGTSGSLVHTATATLSFVDFTITASSPATTNAGQSATSTITVTAVNGFSGVVTLTDTAPSGFTCEVIAPGTITGYGTATVSCSDGAAGIHVLTVTGTSGPLTHSATATFTYAAPDFTLSTSVSSLNMNNGGSGTATVSIAANYGFASTVTLAVTATPAGLSCNLNPPSIQSSSTSTLSCTGTTAGDFTVTITGTSGTTMRTTTLTAHVATVSPVAPAPNTILGLAPAVFYSIIGVIIVAVIAGVTLLLRKSKRVIP